MQMYHSSQSLSTCKWMPHCEGRPGVPAMELQPSCTVVPCVDCSTNVTPSSRIAQGPFRSSLLAVCRDLRHTSVCEHTVFCT